MRKGCASRDTLRRFLDGGLSPAASEDVAAHVEGCRACQRLLDQMINEQPVPARAAWVDEEDDPEEEPAPEFLERLRRILSETGPQPDVIPGWARAQSGNGDGLTVGHGRNEIARAPIAVPGYEILGELSRGGMGVVYKARQVGLNRLVALKMILAGDRARAVDRARFQIEAQAVARLHHPNIVQIYDIGECDGCPYFSMELVHGPTLARACQGRPQPSRLAAKLVQTLARAIHYAHQQGIIHRDLKPANVLLQPDIGWAGDGMADVQGGASPPLGTAIGTPKLADFGLAKRLDDLSLTQNGLILGTPSYMAPEQVLQKGRALGPAVDIYALGTILYELLSGRPPFLAGSIESTLAIVANEDPIPPRRLQPDVPRDVETICLKCLEKEPARRYCTAEELAEDLGRFGNGASIRARAPSTRDRLVKWARRHLAVVAGVAGVIAALALGLAATGVMAVRESRARRRADDNAGQATANARSADAARTIALRQAYQARLAAATAALGTHDIREAARQLQGAPSPLRGWEWRHLHARLDQSLAVVAGLSGFGGATFCPPGERIAVAEGRGYAILDAVTGRRLAVRTTDAPCRQVLSFATRSGLRFVVDRSTETLALDLTDGDGIRIGRIALGTVDPPWKTRRPFVLAMSRDGARVAFQTAQRQAARRIELFDTSTGRKTATCESPGGALLSLDFSPDGTKLAAALESSQLFLFDSATGNRAAVLSGHVGTLRAVAYRPDGRRLASAGDDQTIRVWDVESNRALDILHGHAGRILCLAFSPDGRRLASGGSDSTVRVWKAQGGTALLVLHGHTAAVDRVAFSGDGRTIASTSSDGTARLWDATAPEDAGILHHLGHVYPVAYSPDGRRIASGSWDGRVRLWDAVSARPVHTLADHHQTIGALAFTRDGTRLASWGEDRTIHLWDTATGNAIAILRHENMPMRDSVYRLIVSPDGRRLGAASRHGVRFWDLVSGAERATLHLPLAGVRVVAFSPDGGRLAAAGDDDPKVVVVDAASGELIAEFTGFAGRIQSIAFSPDGRTVLTAGQDPTLRLWEAATGRLLRTFAGHGLEVLAAVFHPDGTRIASGGHDRSILIWDTALGDELVRLPGHSSYVFSLAFSPDGETLVSGSGDYTVRLWDAFPVARRLQARRAADRPGSAAR